MGMIDDSFPTAYNSSDGSEHDGANSNFKGASLTDRYQGPRDADQQKGAEAAAAKGQQDKEDRITNNYQNLYQRSNASTLKAYQQSTKAP